MVSGIDLQIVGILTSMLNGGRMNEMREMLRLAGEDATVGTTDADAGDNQSQA